MADNIEFSLTGLESLLGKLDSVSYDVKRKGGRSALRKAAMVVVNKAKQNALRIDDAETGRSIASNIALRWNGRLFKRTGDLGFRIGVLTGSIRNMQPGNPDTGPGGATPHAMLVELGSEKARAQPYLRPALENQIGEVTNVFVKSYELAIDRALKRARKKAAAGG
jgi:HK97 gp10 family phage protein